MSLSEQARNFTHGCVLGIFSGGLVKASIYLEDKPTYRIVYHTISKTTTVLPISWKAESMPPSEGLVERYIRSGAMLDKRGECEVVHWGNRLYTADRFKVVGRSISLFAALTGTASLFKFIASTNILCF